MPRCREKACYYGAMEASGEVFRESNLAGKPAPVSFFGSKLVFTAVRRLINQGAGFL
jgi:hypothetical protein